MKTRTATIERWHCYGTPYHYLSLRYRGENIGPTYDYPGRLPGHRPERVNVQNTADGIERLRQHAKAQGFTHVRFVGDWQGRTVPKGGKL